jgi:hypothetical protein
MFFLFILLVAYLNLSAMEMDSWPGSRDLSVCLPMPEKITSADQIENYILEHGHCVCLVKRRLSCVIHHNKKIIRVKDLLNHLSGCEKFSALCEESCKKSIIDHFLARTNSKKIDVDIDEIHESEKKYLKRKREPKNEKCARKLNTWLKKNKVHQATIASHPLQPTCAAILETSSAIKELSDELLANRTRCKLAGEFTAQWLNKCMEITSKTGRLDIALITLADIFKRRRIIPNRRALLWYFKCQNLTAEQQDAFFGYIA